MKLSIRVKHLTGGRAVLDLFDLATGDSVESVLSIEIPENSYSEPLQAHIKLFITP